LLLQPSGGDRRAESHRARDHHGSLPLLSKKPPVGLEDIPQVIGPGLGGFGPVAGDARIVDEDI